MSKINLLPPSIAQRNKARKLKWGLFLLQVLIVLAAVLLAFNLQSANERAEMQYYEITNRVLAFDDGPLLLVQELEELRRTENAFHQFYSEHFPISFCSSWVAKVLDTQPFGGNINRFNFYRSEIFVAGEIGSIEGAERHRQELHYHGFHNVNLGRINLINSGRFEYEIRIAVAYEDE